MSKGKGAAKGAPVAPVAENPDGAKFATVRAGTAEHPLSMLINLNCPVDIILDNVKRLLVKRIDAMIQDIKDAQAAEPVPPSAEEGEEQPEADTAPAPSPSEEAVSKLQDIKNKLTNPEYAIELIDKSGASANCKEVIMSMSRLLVLPFPHHCFSAKLALEEIGL